MLRYLEKTFNKIIIFVLHCVQQEAKESCVTGKKRVYLKYKIKKMQKEHMKKHNKYRCFH